MNATWVAASMLPPIAIEQYENGIAAEAIAVEEQSYGQQSSTVCVSRPSTSEPREVQQKRQKIERPNIVEGYAVLDTLAHLHVE